MKQKDIAVIIAVIAVSGIFSLILARFIFAKPADRQVKAEVVDAIQIDFIQPSNKYYNDKSINPTRPIQIGEGSNSVPFRGQ